MRVELRKKPKEQSSSESKECGHGEGVGVYSTLVQSDTLSIFGRTKAGMSPVGVGLRKRVCMI